jgi:hypothetical protein
LFAAIVCEKVPVIAILAMSLTQPLVAVSGLAGSDLLWPDLDASGNKLPRRAICIARAWRTLPLKFVLDNGCPEKIESPLQE